MFTLKSNGTRLRKEGNENKKKENNLIKKARRRYPAEIIMDADYADYLALLANTPYCIVWNRQQKY